MKQMIFELIKPVQKSKKLMLIVAAGFILQLITSIRAIGVSSMDQHFQIIEFSSYQLGLESAGTYNTELKSKLRPTLQIYLFSAYYLACTSIGLDDPYIQLTILRLITGVLMFIIFTLVTLWYCRNSPPGILLWVLLLLNFSWILPYTRTLFSSEMMSGLAFFGTMAWYQYNSEDKKNTLMRSLLAGFFLSLAFYFRFQTGFFIAGFGLWLLFVEKKYKSWLPMIAGFLAGCILNTFLDYRFYGEWAVTPYNYFEFNILQDGASNFGKSSVLRYLGLLLAVIPAPLFSFILLYYIFKASFKEYRNPVFLSIILFIIGHSLVPHKEERFLYPFFNLLPVMAGTALVAFHNYYDSCKPLVKKLLNITIGFTVVLNGIALLVFTMVPYSQTIEFAKRVHNQFKQKNAVIYCLNRTPYETVSGAPMVFYQKNNKHLRYEKIQTTDSLHRLAIKPQYFTATYKDIKNEFRYIDSLGYKQTIYSSTILWKINQFLQANQMPVINDIWVLYELQGR
jgi:GPI mannosyltransferase 3